MPKKEVLQISDVDAFEQRVAALKAEDATLNEKLFHARLEYDILEKAAEQLKKHGH